VKEYEKLALRQAGYMASTGNEYLDAAIEDYVSYGFEMGFIKAREMAIDALETIPEADLHAYDRVGNIGEKEV
jgi:hypothetical protein